MKIEFADTFWKSLDRLKRHNTWWYKTYELFRYNIPWFFRNLWRYRAELWKFRTWDYVFTLRMFKKSLELLKDNIEQYGKEVDDIRGKKVYMMKKAILLLGNDIKDNYVDQASKELGIEINHDYLFENSEPQSITDANKKIFDRAREIEEKDWEELWEIIRGTKYVPSPGKDFYEDQDGSGIKGWWD